MTILNGFPIDGGDLDSLVLGQLSNIRSDNAQLPGAWLSCHSFPGLSNATAPLVSTVSLVIPQDTLIDAVCVTTFQMTAASVVTVTITGDGGVALQTIKVTGSVPATLSKLARLLFDGTKTNPSKDFSTTSRMVRCWPKGSTITLSIVTTSIAAGAIATVTLVGRQFHGRE